MFETLARKHLFPIHFCIAPIAVLTSLEYIQKCIRNAPLMLNEWCTLIGTSVLAKVYRKPCSVRQFWQMYTGNPAQQVSSGKRTQETLLAASYFRVSSFQHESW